MKYAFIFLTFLSLIQISCDNSNKRSESIILEDSMVSILVDIQVLEATYNTRLIHLEDRNEKMESYYQEIFEKHQTNADQFNESYTYYEENPEILEAIYDRVLENLEALQTEEESKYSKKKDSKKKKKKKKEEGLVIDKVENQNK